MYITLKKITVTVFYFKMSFFLLWLQGLIISAQETFLIIIHLVLLNHFVYYGCVLQNLTVFYSFIFIILWINYSQKSTLHLFDSFISLFN